jgi:hypothetical protein
MPGMDGADGNFKEDMLTLASFNAWVKDNGIPYGSIMYITVNSLGVGDTNPNGSYECDLWLMN